MKKCLCGSERSQVEGIFDFGALELGLHVYSCIELLLTMFNLITNLQICHTALRITELS